MNSKKMISGYSYKIANNSNAVIAREIIHSVMKEYGIYSCDDKVDSDLLNIEKSYLDGFFGIVIDAEVPVGTFGLIKLKPGVAEIRKMYLLPKARGKGLGKWMVHFLLAKAKELNYERVELETASALKEAIGLYQQLGFQPVDNNNITSSCDRAFFMKI